MTRRELVRRLGAACLTMSAASVAMACEAPAPKGTRLGGGARIVRAPSAAHATPPSAGTTGVTVRPDDPRIEVSRPDVRGADGAPLMAYLAVPRGVPAPPGVLVAHGVRGPTEHMHDVVRRFATAGLAALTIDLASRAGGLPALPDPSAYRAALFARGTRARREDYRAVLEYLRGEFRGAAAVGWGFGGNSVWKMLDARLELDAAVTFYGSLPANYTELSRTRTAVFAGYAELDPRVTSTAPSVEAMLERAGVPYRITVYPGVDRGFDDDSAGSEHYDPQQARRAWEDILGWLHAYLPR